MIEVEQEQLDPQKIKTALTNTLNNNSELRDEANHYLNKVCEPNPQFQMVLLNIIRELGQSKNGQQTMKAEEYNLLQY